MLIKDKDITSYQLLLTKQDRVLVLPSVTSFFDYTVVNLEFFFSFLLFGKNGSVGRWETKYFIGMALFSLWIFSSTITAQFLIYTSYPTWPTQNTKMSISFLNWFFAVHVKGNNKWNLWALIKLKVNYLIPILAGKVHLITTHHMVRSRTIRCRADC